MWRSTKERLQVAKGNQLRHCHSTGKLGQVDDNILEKAVQIGGVIDTGAKINCCRKVREGE